MEVVVGVLRDQVVSPDLVGWQHEFALIDDIPGCLCCVGGGGSVEPYLPNSSELS